MHTDHLGRAGHFIILVLVAAAIVAGIIGEPSDAIAVIVLLNAMFGLVQEYRLDLLLIALALCIDVRLDASGNVIGDPTETALFDLALEKGFLRDGVDKKHPRLAEILFDSGRKLMSTFHPWENGTIVSFTKGLSRLERSCFLR